MLVIMETIPITEAKARIAELAERVAREHDHFTITRNGRADLRQSREDFADGATYSPGQVRAKLEQRRRSGPQ